MKLVEVRVIKAHRGLSVGEVVRADRRVVEQGWAELVGAPQAAPGPVTAMSAKPPAPIAAQPVADEALNQPVVDPAPVTQETEVEFKPAAPLDEAVAKPRERAPKKPAAVEKEPKPPKAPKPPRVRKGRYNRRDMKAE